MNEATRYIAFISYSHADERVAAWLHKSIETYPVPKRLVGQPSPLGSTPARLKPLFRDRDELASSADLSSSITQALEQSAFLIVICSPNAANSKWVNEEILAFQRLGKSDRILALIVEGEPAESFPEALRSAEPIAADMRPTGDGKRNALLKLLAGLLGVGFDDLRQRDARRRQRRMATALAASIVLALLLAGLSLAALLNSREANRQRARAQENLQSAQTVIDRFLTTVADKLDHVSGASEVRIELLKDASAYYQDYLARNRDAPSLLQGLSGNDYRLADLLEDFGHLAAARLARERSSEAQEKALSSRPDDLDGRVKLAMGLRQLSDACLALGDREAADRNGERAISISRSVAEAAPTNFVYQRYFAHQSEEYGSYLMRVGQRERAGEALMRALRLFEAQLNAQHTPTARLEFAICCRRVGEWYLARNDLAAARNSFQTGHRRLEDLLQREPNNVWYRFFLGLSGTAMGRLSLAEGQPAVAADILRDAVADLRVAAQVDPSFKHRKELPLSLALLAEASAKAGKPGDAKALIAEAVARQEALVNESPENVEILAALASMRTQAASTGDAPAPTPVATAASASAAAAGDPAADLDPRDPAAAAGSGIRRVVGRVEAVRPWHGDYYINFGRGAVSGLIRSNDVARFEALTSAGVAGLRGRTVRLRGPVELSRNGAPYIPLRSNDQLELLDEASAQATTPENAEIEAVDVAALERAIGRVCTVAGSILGASETSSALVVLRFEDSPLTVVIKPEQRADVERRTGDLKGLRGRGARVRGLISTYHEHPQIILTRPDQFELLDGGP